MATQTLFTLDQFLDLPDQEGVRRELDEGQLIEEMGFTSPEHGIIQSRLLQRILNWTDQTGAPFIVACNVGFALGPDTARVPDVFAVRKSAIAAMERVKGGARRGAPDLAVEVVSATNTAEDLERKIDQYLNAGAAAVWVFYPKTRHVMVHRRSGETLRLASGQTIEEPDLLPGLAIPVNDVFANLEELS